MSISCKWLNDSDIKDSKKFKERQPKSQTYIDMEISTHSIDPPQIR